VRAHGAEIVMVSEMVVMVDMVSEHADVDVADAVRDK